MKGWFLRLTLIGFLGFIIALAAVEFGLSKFGPQIVTSPRDITEPDKYLGWKGVSNAEKIHKFGPASIPVKRNSHGFRDKERTYERKESTFRILVLDASFTEAQQVPLEETFPYILEEKLNAESGKRFEVLNLGIGGFSIAQKYLMLKYYGLKYQPDLVFLDFIIFNDVSYNSVTFDDSHLPRPYFILNNGELEEVPFKIKDEREGIPFRSVKDRVRTFLPHTYYLLAGGQYPPWLQNVLQKIGLINSEPVPRDKPKQSQPPVQGIPRYLYDVYAHQYPPEWQDAWEVTQALILKLKNELGVKKIGFVVVVIPMELEFRPDVWKKTLDTNPQMRALKFDLRKPERMLSNFLEAHNIEYLLLRPGFEKYNSENGKDLYTHYASDYHLNGKGHALTAELLYKKLIQDKLVHERSEIPLGSADLTVKQPHLYTARDIKPEN